MVPHPVRESNRTRVVSRLEEALGPDLIRKVQLADGWPSSCELWDGRRWRVSHLYLGVIGPSGRNRANELRMQNASGGAPIKAAALGEAVLLLGRWVLATGADVVVAWNAKQRIGRQTRFSMFVPLTVVNDAVTNGQSEFISSSGEHIKAFVSTNVGAIQSLIADTRQIPMTKEEVHMTDLDDVTAETESDLEGLAEKLAALSEGEIPNGFASQPMPFDANDVDWKTNNWLTRVAEVQEWLYLDSPIELESGAQNVLDTLFSGMGDTSRFYTILEGHASLTSAGVDTLGSRLDTATTLKQEFAEALESGRSVAEATRDWNEAWEETPSTIDDPPSDVHAKVDTWNISSFRDRAKDGGIELNPTYQRDNVWTDKESSELIDSILRGIPLPSIILNQRKGDDSLEIVDGKQRLTAILRFIGYHPEALKFTETMEEEAQIPAKLFHTDYPKWRKAVKKHRGLTGEDERTHFLPFKYSIPKAAREAGPLLAFGGKYYSEILQNPKSEVMIQGRTESVRKVFELPMSSYKLSVILYEDTNIRQIHKVFGLYNRQGKKLNATEVRNAIYHHLSITKLLLLLSGDNRDIDSLAPYIKKDTFDQNTIPDLLKSMNVGDGRFNRTKITSWVAAVLLHRLESKSGKLSWPGSTSLIEGMMRTIADSKAHPMTADRACEHFAIALRDGAALLGDLLTMEAFIGLGGEKWEEVPAVAAWTACTLAAISGVQATQETRNAVQAATQRVKRLKKQQAKTQWGHLASITLDLLSAMGVEVGSLGVTLEKRFGYNCIPTLEVRRTHQE